MVINYERTFKYLDQKHIFSNHFSVEIYVFEEAVHTITLQLHCRIVIFIGHIFVISLTMPNVTLLLFKPDIIHN